MSVVVTINERALRAMMAPTGTIGRQVLDRARRVEARARMRAPVQWGTLRRSINLTAPRLAGAGWSVDIVADVAYAQWIHRGVREYRYGTGRLVYARAGARPFLTDALREVFG